jgi:hypothetical protein
MFQREISLESELALELELELPLRMTRVAKPRRTSGNSKNVEISIRVCQCVIEKGHR